MTEINNQTATRQPPAQPAEAGRERTNLIYRYGTIGIEAVAAAVRYADKDAGRKPVAPRIDQRFVESAI